MLTGFLSSCSSGEDPLAPAAPPAFAPQAMDALVRPTGDRAGLRHETPTSPKTRESSESPNTSQEPLLRGEIQLDPSLRSEMKGERILFLIARPTTGGPPVLVKRMTVQSFPVAFTLGPEDAMVPGESLRGPVIVIARLDADGAAGPRTPEDWEGKTPSPVTFGTSVTIRVRR